MYLIIWQFRAKPSTLRQFVSIYGAKGAWARLFRKARGFIATRLIADPANPHTFLTVDVWQSRSAHLAAKRVLRREYAELDAACEKLTLSERRIGTFSIRP
jgi:quinol monooxygenase YgiN